MVGTAQLTEFLASSSAMNAGRAPIVQAAYLEQLGAADEMPAAGSTSGSPGTSPSSPPSRCAPASKPITCAAA